MESLRKIGVNAFILQVGNNHGSDSIIRIAKRTAGKCTFDVLVEAIDSYTARSLEEDFKFISNSKFREFMKNDNKAVVNKAGSNEPSWPIPVLKENLHYYMENGFMVFTEAYHSARGRCCGNACRHCPFEHANVRKK